MCTRGGWYGHSWKRKTAQKVARGVGCGSLVVVKIGHLWGPCWSFWGEKRTYVCSLWGLLAITKHLCSLKRGLGGGNDVRRGELRLCGFGLHGDFILRMECWGVSVEVYHVDEHNTWNNSVLSVLCGDCRPQSMKMWCQWRVGHAIKAWFAPL